ncbi:PAS domain-containing protein [Deinococcus aquaedulcis]|uniref:PAS domain-containing protein n=1 Tax=Deinococcus aquaedulcis TaxID=2840455 RepID=UPI001C82F68C|nr:PAS domain-containing protein [Deinococcus aquaedulcis]
MTSDDRAALLRQQAEQALHTQDSPPVPVPRPAPGAQEHELLVHQIELRLQNEELNRKNLELELARQEYEQLFDFAPVGYATLDDTGVVLRANLTLCRMLGVDRA